MNPDSADRTCWEPYEFASRLAALRDGRKSYVRSFDLTEKNRGAAGEMKKNAPDPFGPGAPPQGRHRGGHLCSTGYEKI